MPPSLSPTVTSPGVNTPNRSRLFTASIAVLALIWIAIVISLMVTDVWDESRALNLFQQHGFADLITSNWMQTAGKDVVLFRPVPMIVFTAIAAVLENPENIWRLLRGLNAVAVLLSGVVLVAVIRRMRGPDLVRDLVFSVVFLFSGSAIITATWFANGFDAMALLLIALGTLLLVRDRGWLAGAAIGLAFFCKEVAVLGLSFVVVLAWMKEVDRSQARRALLIAGICLALFLVFRSMVVVPGSDSDLRRLSAGGALAAFLNLPVTFWWQGADVPVPALGVVAFVASLVWMTRWQAAVGLASLYGVAAALYGPILNFGPDPLISPSNFAGRLYLVPAALALVLVAVYGRRVMYPFLLIPVLWGAGITAERHLRFQHAYLTVYEKAAGRSQPFHVHCKFYAAPFEHRIRNVVFERSNTARWVFKSDGSLTRRKRGGRAS